MSDETEKSLKQQKRLLKQQQQKLFRHKDGDASITIEELRRDWKQCHFYLKNKYRLCNVTRSKNSLYCGVHRPASENNGRERIPCPIDPSHTCWKDQMNQHILICPTSKDVELMQKQPFYCLNCNGGKEITSSSTTKEKEEEVEDEGEVDLSPIDGAALCEKIIRVFEQVVAPLIPFSVEDFTKYVNKAAGNETGDNTAVLEGVSDAIGNDIESYYKNDLYADIEKKVMCALAEKQTSFDRIRHAKQDAMIVYQMYQHGLIHSPSASSTSSSSLTTTTTTSRESSSSVLPSPQDLVYVELGAGKGLLGLAVHTVSPQSALVLVERSGMKKTADRALRLENNGKWYRARMDIRHCLVSKLPGVIREKQTERGEEQGMEVEGGMEGGKEGEKEDDRHVVIIAKHLCGLASDLALRSLDAFATQTSTSSSSTTTTLSHSPPSSQNMSNSLNDRAVGVAIATCCHHACDWNDYTGKEWMTKCGFTKKEFLLMRQWSGWASTLKSVLMIEKKKRRRKEENDGASVWESGGGGGMEGAGMEGGKEGESGELESKMAKIVEKENAEEEEGEGGEEGEDIGDNEHPPQSALLPSLPSSLLPTLLRPLNLSAQEMTRIGICIKRIFDEGRVEYLTSKGLIAKQVQYCNPSLSLECVMILATKPTTTTTTTTTPNT